MIALLISLQCNSPRASYKCNIGHDHWMSPLVVSCFSLLCTAVNCLCLFFLAAFDQDDIIAKVSHPIGMYVPGC